MDKEKRKKKKKRRKEKKSDSEFKNCNSVHTVFMCFVFISEQTATSALYNIN
jgi:hypothetical protein